MKKRYSVPLILIGLMIIINIIARFSRPFADFYVTKIFPHISNCISFISGLFPFSLGEMLTVAAVALVLFGIPLFLLLLIFCKGRRKKIAAFTGTLALWIVCYVTVTETMNCFIMYQCTPFSEKYFPQTEVTSFHSGVV